DELLEVVKKKFCSMFSEQIASLKKSFKTSFDFDDTFTHLMYSVEERTSRKKQEPKTPKAFSETKKGQEIMKQRGNTAQQNGTKKNNKENKQSSSEDDEASDEASGEPDQ